MAERASAPSESVRCLKMQMAGTRKDTLQELYKEAPELCSKGLLGPLPHPAEGEGGADDDDGEPSQAAAPVAAAQKEEGEKLTASRAAASAEEGGTAAPVAAASDGEPLRARVIFLGGGRAALFCGCEGRAVDLQCAPRRGRRFDCLFEVETSDYKTRSSFLLGTNNAHTVLPVCTHAVCARSVVLAHCRHICIRSFDPRQA